MKSKSLLVFKFIFFPFILIKDIWAIPRTILKKFLLTILVSLLFGLPWLFTYIGLFASAQVLLYEIGLVDKLTDVNVSGTSMEPTIHDGSTVSLHSPKKFSPARGDIISFTSKETGDLHLLKRIIALPGESLVLKNGRVMINNQLANEPFTNEQNLTYGNTFVSDCQAITVPDNSFFVMGDNRRVSRDSRAIGVVPRDLVAGIIKSDSSFSLDSLESIPTEFAPDRLNAKEVLKLLNEKRKDASVNPLVSHATLTGLADTRAQEISDNFESWKAGSSPVEKSLTQSGYRYNLIHEYVTFGYLNPQIVIEQIFNQMIEKDYAISSKFTEIGIGVATRKYLECEYPVVTFIYSWPSIPTYDPDTINFWSKEAQTTTKLISDLQSWVGMGKFEETKLRNLISSISEIALIATRISNKMENRQWLTAQDHADTRRYQDLVKSSNATLEELFGPAVKGVTTASPPDN